MVSWSGVSRYSYSSGTGLLTERTTTTSRVVMARKEASILVVSPSVADISRNCVRGSESSGTCHATPRSLSA